MKRRTAQRAEKNGPEPDVEAASARVGAEIVAAWDDDAAPGVILPHCQRPDCPEIAAYFSNKTWREVTIGEVQRAAGASRDNPLLFLPPPAVRHFLAAFLLLYLEAPASLGDFEAPLVQTLCPHDGWREVADQLTPVQQRAALSFLRHVERTRRGDPRVAEGIAFWERRTGGQGRSPA